VNSSEVNRRSLHNLLPDFSATATEDWHLWCRTERLLWLINDYSL